MQLLNNVKLSELEPDIRHNIYSKVPDTVIETLSYLHTHDLIKKDTMECVNILDLNIQVDTVSTFRLWIEVKKDKNHNAVKVDLAVAGLLPNGEFAKDKSNNKNDIIVFKAITVTKPMLDALEHHYDKLSGVTYTDTIELITLANRIASEFYNLVWFKVLTKLQDEAMEYNGSPYVRKPKSKVKKFKQLKLVEPKDFHNWYSARIKESLLSTLVYGVTPDSVDIEKPNTTFNCVTWHFSRVNPVSLDGYEQGLIVDVFYTPSNTKYDKHYDMYKFIMDSRNTKQNIEFIINTIINDSNKIKEEYDKQQPGKNYIYHVVKIPS